MYTLCTAVTCLVSIGTPCGLSELPAMECQYTQLDLDLGEPGGWSPRHREGNSIIFSRHLWSLGKHTTLRSLRINGAHSKLPQE